MGRKPNKLVLEFFERGPKLEDSSNRYQHTCKSCGEKFPKGRIDSLTTHLLKKCPAVSFIDRQRAIHQLSETPNQHGTYHPLAIAMRNEQVAQHAHPEDLNFASSYQMSALETLAEVSRQQLDHNGDYVQAHENPRKRRRSSVGGEANNGPMSPSMFFHEFPVETQVEGAPRAPDVNNQLLAGIRAFAEAHGESTQEEPILNDIPTAQMVPAQQMALAASAATEMLPSSGPQHVLDPGLSGDDLPENFFQLTNRIGQAQTDTDNAIDPQLQDNGTQNIPRDQEDQEQQAAPGQYEITHQPLAVSVEAGQSDVFQETQQETHHPGHPEYPQFDNTTLEDAPSAADTITAHVPPQAHFMSDFNISPYGTSKTKVRGRFSASRRKEVQEVRKQGACVRCRMLKKPCSGGTPCNTCRQVESARLWKQPCVRTRIADEFDLYSAGLYTVLAFHETSNAKLRSIPLESSSHQVEAAHFPEADVQPASISTLKGRISDEVKIDPALTSPSATKIDPTLTCPPPDQSKHTAFELIDQDKEDLGAILDSYIKHIGPSLFDAELSSFMRPTLLLAAQLTKEKLDPLLSRALDLWTTTQILVDPALQWNFFTTQNTIFLTEESGARQPILPTSEPLTCRLMTRQLLAQCEKRAAYYAKILMNDLERRLLLRQQAATQNFETFLTAVILLNCVERMCWHFYLWVAQGADVAEENVSDGSDRPNWPLETPPDEYVAKGERIAEVLAMILRMRGVPPHLCVGDDGIIREQMEAQQSSSLLIPAVNSVSNEAEGAIDMESADAFHTPQQSALTVWLEGVHMSADTLLAAQGSRAWDETNCRSWDMRWVSGLVLMNS